MKYITQKRSNDCGIACLAMLHETSHRCMDRFVRAYFARRKMKFDGLNWYHIRDISRMIGSPLKLYIPKDKNKLIQKIEGRKAIVIVPAQDSSGDRHAVFWDRDVLLDPAPADCKRYGRSGKTALHLVDEAYILTEDD